MCVLSRSNASELYAERSSSMHSGRVITDTAGVNVEEVAAVVEAITVTDAGGVILRAVTVLPTEEIAAMTWLAPPPPPAAAATEPAIAQGAVTGLLVAHRAATSQRSATTKSRPRELYLAGTVLTILSSLLAASQAKRSASSRAATCWRTHCQ